MSTKNSTPTSSPRAPKSVRVEAPSTPPLAAKPRIRVLAGLSTPDPLHDSVPFSPGLKRSNSGLVRSPGDVMSPYSANNLLKTPGNGAEVGEDDDDTPRRAKLMRTPQYFSPGKRLFTEDSSPNKKELGEISSQLKSRLSLAFGSLQQREKAGSGVGIAPVKLDFAGGPFLPGKQESPTRMAMGRTNLNLQTLQASPQIETRSRHASFDLRHSPILGGDALQFLSFEHQQVVSIPSPDEESSAHNALMVALSRAKERRKSHTNEHRRPSFGLRLPLKLPPISVGALLDANGTSEQEAVYSLMSLSSPQANKHDFSALQSAAQMHVDTSKELSRSSSVAMPVLPPVAGLTRNPDDDETDVEVDTASEDDDDTS